ncbi:MAG: RagB/SusD family nutrient uptake outer membrane protein [Maribacter sp.]|nr:MAG: RagB/SusD family nutrient uptake outer membrane protein [Maribacter sp.]
MKKFKYSFLIFTIVIGMFFSCTDDDFLEIKPKSFFTSENVYTNPEGFEAGLVNLRKSLTNTTYGSKRYNLLCEWAASEAGAPTFQLDWSGTTPNSDRFYQFLNLYTDSYEQIKNANTLISRIDDIEWPDQSVKDKTLAEAYWHRSFWYYWLVNAYGDVPFIGNELTGPKLDFQTHSRWAVLGKIQGDMEANVKSLPDVAAAGAITKAAGNHLLTKIYLANLEFDKAIASSTAIIDGPHALMTQRFGSAANDPDLNLLWDLHRPENKNLPENTETILAMVDRYESPSDAKTQGTYLMRHYNCAWYNGAVKDSEGNAGTEADGDQYATLGRGNPDMIPSSYSLYDIWNNFGHTWQNTPDLRRADANWIDNHEILYNKASSIDFGKPIDPKLMSKPSDSLVRLFPAVHYKFFVAQEDSNVRPVGGAGDMYVYRLAETYLLRAEAYFWKDQLDMAAADLNSVRTRANAVPITASDVDLGFIFDERARELYTESIRHAEMVRASYILASLNRNGYSLTSFSENNWWYDRVINLNNIYPLKYFFYTSSANIEPYNVLWPIKSEVITANTQGTINQNIGYVGAEGNVTPLETIDE